MTDEATDLDLLRTRVLLEALQGDQERLHAALVESGVTGFADQADWLIAHRSTDRKLAWKRHWNRLGIPVADIEPRPERYIHDGRRAVPKPAKVHRPVAPIIPPDRQLQIALGVLERKDTAA